MREEAAPALPLHAAVAARGLGWSSRQVMAPARYFETRARVCAGTFAKARYLRLSNRRQVSRALLQSTTHLL
jgi:hypothetical protein